MLKRTKTNLILHGIILLAIAVLCFATPQGTLVSLAWILGILFIVGAVLTFFWGRRANEEGVDPMHLIAALLMAAVGIMIIVRPNIIAILVGLFILLEGIDFVMQAFRYHRYGVRHWTVLLLAGVLSIVLGLWAVLSPWVGAAMLSIVIGIGCLCVSVDCFAALIGIGRIEKAIEKAAEASAEDTEFVEAEVVK